MYIVTTFIKGTQIFFKTDTCVIFVLDSSGSATFHGFFYMAHYYNDVPRKEDAAKKEISGNSMLLIKLPTFFIRHLIMGR